MRVCNKTASIQKPSSNWLRKFIAVLLVALVWVSSFFIYLVPPSFAVVFESMGAKLPQPTALAIDWHWLICLFPLPVLILVARWYLKPTSFRRYFLLAGVISVLFLDAMVICSLYLPVFHHPVIS